MITAFPPLTATSPRRPSHAQSSAREAQETAKENEERIDQLVLVCAAMWELLREKAGLTEDDLITRVAEIDARDGIADGKLTAKVQKCPKCSRVISPKHMRCLYCGFQIPIDSMFKTI